VVAIWDDPVTGEPLIAIASQALSDAAIKRLVQEALFREIVGPIAARLSGVDAAERAATFCGLVSGVVFSRYLLGVEPLASMDPAEVVRRFAPALQQVLG
jgi:hypothetical protein